MDWSLVASIVTFNVFAGFVIVMTAKFYYNYGTTAARDRLNVYLLDQATDDEKPGVEAAIRLLDKNGELHTADYG